MPASPADTVGNAAVASVDASLFLLEPGPHRAMLRAANPPLPEPTGVFEDDRQRAVAAGARLVVGEMVQVTGRPPTNVTLDGGAHPRKSP